MSRIDNYSRDMLSNDWLPTKNQEHYLLNINKYIYGKIILLMVQEFGSLLVNYGKSYQNTYF